MTVNVQTKTHKEYAVVLQENEVETLLKLTKLFKQEDADKNGWTMEEYRTLCNMHNAFYCRLEK